eukprot:CAMPEP_0113464638 /NCGR_PEP_ID=MMETSP0014_2-20120614/13307_1 /TAXON_ID=2857 /ORGANISM="Nitzschia sp." /LENGTH=440 /DNA_ID=CAMNT_0000356731 /DNA_START=187 /DNA_END=1509 /DNA_ORIENTATION=+ /assembly_acc=CAM_ASM_000159
MARPRPYSTNGGGGGGGGGVDPSRKKLLNTLGMFRQLESYESSQALRGTRSSTNSKKKRHHHHHGLHHQHVGNDTNGNRPIKPQHIRHRSDMSFLGGAAAGGGPLNANNANVNSTGGGGAAAASGVVAVPIVRPTRSALHNSTGYFQTTLNDVDDEDDVDDNVVGNANNTKDATTTTSTPPPSRQDSGDDDDESRRQVDNKLRFHDVVSVVEIPSHAQYSNRVKSSLWRDRHELNEMVQRNITEFDYENYDWESVVEEADFYIDGSTGERVHPAHVMLDEDDEEEDDYEGEEQRSGADNYHYANEALQQFGGSGGQGESKQEKVIQINSTAHFDGGNDGGNESDGPPMLHRSAPVMGGSGISSGGIDADVLAEKLATVAVMVDEKENGSSNSTNVQQQEKSNSSNDNTDNTADRDDDDDDGDDDDHFFLPLRRYGSQKLQ